METVTQKCNESKSEIWRTIPMDLFTKQLLHLRLREHWRRERREPDQGVCCETATPRNVRRCNPKISPTLLLRHDLNKDNNSSIHAKLDREKPIKIKLTQNLQTTKEISEWEK